ncbi:MAG: hypothetical protein HFF13_04510 [Angelakisella sp.]|nr:hypothetical protein [Angelakisella sp.]
MFWKFYKKFTILFAGFCWLILQKGLLQGGAATGMEEAGKPKGPIKNLVIFASFVKKRRGFLSMVFLAKKTVPVYH